MSQHCPEPVARTTSRALPIERALDAQLDTARHLIAALRAANAAGDAYASSGTAGFVSSALRALEELVAHAAIHHGAPLPALAARLASARRDAQPALAAAFTPTADAVREAMASAGRARWERELAAWRAARRS